MLCLLGSRREVATLGPWWDYHDSYGRDLSVKDSVICSLYFLFQSQNMHHVPFKQLIPGFTCQDFRQESLPFMHYLSNRLPWSARLLNCRKCFKEHFKITPLICNWYLIYCSHQRLSSMLKKVVGRMGLTAEETDLLAQASAFATGGGKSAAFASAIAASASLNQCLTGSASQATALAKASVSPPYTSRTWHALH